MRNGVHALLTPSLDAMTQSVGKLECIPRKNVRAGDCVIVATCNSIYCLRARADGSFLVSGGWFDRTNAVPVRVNVNGCTWGGSAIKTDIVAGVGLCLEFSNRVTTSPVQKIIILPRERQN